MLFEMVGSIYFLTPELDQLGHKYPVVRSFVDSFASGTSTAHAPGEGHSSNRFLL